MPTDDKFLTRIAALLRKAEHASTPQEADAYLTKAQQLSTLYQVDLEHARTHTARGQAAPVPVQRRIPIGTRGKVGLRTYVDLFLTIARNNNLKCDIASDATAVYAYGFEQDITLTETLYASLVVQMIRASDAYIRSGDHRTERVYRPKRVKTTDWWGRPTTELEYGMHPVSGRTARINFQDAFSTRIGARLRAARHQALQQQQATAQREPAATATGAELVLASRELAVHEFHKRTSDARGTYRSSTSSAYSGRAAAAGDTAARNARLSAARPLPASRSAISA